MQRRRVLAAIGTGTVTAVAGCAGGAAGGTRTPDYDVGMTASAFRPEHFTVDVGDTVTWRNTNSRAHTVTAYDAGIPADAAYFASGGFENERAAREAYTSSLGGSIPSGDTYAHRFHVPGEYHYLCVPHERGGMVGSIEVAP